MFALNLEKSIGLNNGINVHNLKPGITIYAVTQNSLYKIIKGNKDQYHVLIQGGKRFIKPVDANFTGSSFGGFILKLGWIGYGMLMEFYVYSFKKNYKTSGVQAARIVGDGWEYDMEWDKISLEVKIE